MEIVVANSFTSVQPACHDDESSALMQFKDSFAIHKSASLCDPKVLQWKSHGVNSSNCCLWNGVQCDGKTGHVIGLDLSSSCLFGSINSNSTLFNLVHLQSLNLADNDFNSSEIPVAVGKLLGLTYLNLSHCFFWGQIPLEISHLYKLSHLDLSFNHNENVHSIISKLRSPNLGSLLQNLTNLEVLHLSGVDLSSRVPDYLANFTSLTYLMLSDCELQGEFPSGVFQLPNLRILDVSSNGNLKGYIPDFHHKSPLKELKLGGSGFSGGLPSSIQMLDSLDLLDFRDCNFSGPIPSSLGKLTQLTFLVLSENSFSGHIPRSFQNLTRLTKLVLRYNQLFGPIPPLSNLTNLNLLDFSDNQLHGRVPQSLSNLMNLETLYLHSNKLNGALEFDMFFRMKSLAYLDLGRNNLSLLFSKGNKNATSSKFKLLALESCNLSEFPYFIRHQNELERLSLAKNQICCEIPKWMWKTSIDTLVSFTIEDNLLTGFLPVALPWVNLLIFAVSFNRLQGTLPIPPPSIVFYNVSNNLLSGEVPIMFCNLSSPYNLDLSNNTLDGNIPECLGNLSSTLYVLNLRNNFFKGTIPKICNNKASNLRIIDLSYNKLQGQLPRTLSNCKMLEGIVVSNNQLSDVFPSWLGSLPVLKLLILQHNGFYGVIEKPKGYIGFPELRVLDISFNNFTGELPSHYVSSWNAMKAIDPHPFTYLGVIFNFTIPKTALYQNKIRFAITITTKGVNRYYGAIQDIFAFIDMSSNKFEGEISTLFGNLKSLHSLNLSNNMLTGCIPSSLGNLTELESLDLSQNNLSGEIPQQLKQLMFLASFNVSYNKLTGPIPQGHQFSAFESSSFEGNPGLCGDLLFKKCGDLEPSSLPPSAFEENDDLESMFKLDWKFVLVGFVSGLVVGVALGDMVIIRRHGWLVKMQCKRRRRRRYQRN
nr:receptor-like protein 7 [Ziziphus jujuba var. spinosa]